tara:strand:+ start:1384 stop:2298 length:915 start_codon:yes stop_codon:yes gene_type:complete
MANKGTHSYIGDNRNTQIKIYINGEYYLREDAKISVFDSGFLLGDGVWEGIRLHKKKLVFIDEHIDRLFEGAKKISIDIGLEKNDLINLLYDVVEKNQMFSDIHIRLIVSRGMKSTPYQHPNVNIGGPSIVIIPEYKKVDPETIDRGVSLHTVKTLRSTSDILDPKINSLSKLNCILACVEADKLGVDEGLMFDIDGNISTCNSTNFFIVKDDSVWTSTGDYCLHGVTRSKVIEVCKIIGLDVQERDFDLNDVLTADEAFVTGTFAGVIHVNKINKVVLSKNPSNITLKIREGYYKLISDLYES